MHFIIDIRGKILALYANGRWYATPAIAAQFPGCVIVSHIVSLNPDLPGV
jgi:hypothetical protein